MWGHGGARTFERMTCIVTRSTVERFCGVRDRDRLVGGRGGDRLVGGPGRDTCLGGHGSDHISCP